MGCEETTQVFAMNAKLLAQEKSYYLEDTISLSCHGIQEFPDHLNSPELVIFIVYKCPRYKMIEIKLNLSLPQSMDGS